MLILNKVYSKPSLKLKFLYPAWSQETHHTHSAPNGNGGQVFPELSTHSTAVAMGTSDLSPDDTQAARFVMPRAGSLPVNKKCNTSVSSILFKTHHKTVIIIIMKI